jgi:hypothetical protein
MEEWLLMQGFYHGLTQKAHEHLDATAEGLFLSLTVGKAKLLMEKILEKSRLVPRPHSILSSE